MENINDLIGQEAFEQITRLDKQLGGLINQFEKSANASKLLNNALAGTSGANSRKKAIDETATSLQNLSNVEKEIIKTEIKLADANDVLATKLAQLKLAVNEQNKSNSDYAKTNKQAEGSINQLSFKLTAMRKEYDALSASLRNSPLGKDLLQNIQKTDSALKQLDATTGRHQRNVGNYQGQLFGLTQVFREIPAFTYSAQTGILGLSNNLPILADNFKSVANATNQATGKINGTVGALKIFASSIFSFGNVFAIAIGLFTIFSKEIFEFIKGTEKAKDKVEDLTSAQDALNMALASTDYKKAVTDINELRINIDLAKKGFIDKTDVVNQYNETLGDTMGKVKTLDEAEMMLVKNGEAYIKMTLLKAAANLSLEKAAQEYLKAELQNQIARQKLKEDVDDEGNYSPGPLASFALTLKNGLGSDADNFKKQTQKEVDGIKKEGDRFKDIATKFQQDAASIAKSMGMDFFGSDLSKGVKKPKDKKDKEDAIDLIKAEYEAELALLQTKMRDEGLAQELQYDKLIDMAVKYREKLKTAKGLTKKEQQDKAKFDDELSKAEIENYDKILIALEKTTEEKVKLDDAELQRALKIAEEKLKRNQDYAKMELELIKENLAAQEDMLEREDRLNKEAWDKKVERLENYARLVQGFTEILTTISNAQYESEMAQIEQRSKFIEENYDSELKKIEKSNLSQQKKEEATQKLETQTEALRKKNDRDRITAARKKARMDKAADIANIISGTAVAVVNALKTPPPLGFAQAAIITGLGLANLARAIATPLPQFADGTDDSGKAGPAIVGERGTELGITKDGKMFLTPSEPTLMHLPAHTKIINHEELKKNAHNQAMQSIINSGASLTSKNYELALIASYEENTSELKKLRKDFKDKQFSAKMYSYNGFNDYINKHT